MRVPTTAHHNSYLTLNSFRNANEVSGSPEIEPAGSRRATGELRQRVMIAHNRTDASDTGYSKNACLVFGMMYQAPCVATLRKVTKCVPTYVK